MLGAAPSFKMQLDKEFLNKKIPWPKPKNKNVKHNITNYSDPQESKIQHVRMRGQIGGPISHRRVSNSNTPKPQFK